MYSKTTSEAKIRSDKNSRAWVSMVFTSKKWSYSRKKKCGCLLNRTTPLAHYFLSYSICEEGNLLKHLSFISLNLRRATESYSINKIASISSQVSLTWCLSLAFQKVWIMPNLEEYPELILLKEGRFCSVRKYSPTPIFPKHIFRLMYVSCCSITLAKWLHHL